MKLLNRPKLPLRKLQKPSSLHEGLHLIGALTQGKQMPKDKGKREKKKPKQIKAKAS